MDRKIRWGILATGSIADTFARDLKHSHHGTLAGVASRTPARAQEFCDMHGGTACEDYAALLARDDIDAVYIATPHDAHVIWAHRALEAGKATLCEKPLGLNQGEVLSLYGAAARNGVLLVEALMYVMHPRMHLARKLLDDGEIGTVTGFSSSFGFAFPFTPEHRLYNRDRAGGGILDIGIYPLTAARFLLGEPASLTGEARLAPTKVDAEARAQLDYGDFSAELHCAVDTEIPWQICVTGSKGTMTIDRPWHSGPDNQAVIITLEDGTQRIYESDETRPLYAVEADHVAECMLRGEGASEFVSPDFSINTAYWLDRWREAGGVTYAADVLDINGFDARPPQAGRYGAMPVLQLNGLDKPVSRLVLGTDNQIDAATMAAMADAFFEQGGTCFDTAHIYSGGMSEKALGAWIKARGMRENVVILGKGAHPPDCTPDAMARQLEESLDRLQTDYLDIYCLHRDNPDIPIAEWVDALHAEMDKGRIRVFGGSNWTAARIDAANEYAQSKGGSG
ncbi:MAG: aldo/keto reductase, partial [Pseudomonadota bacterium]|nr:aldo/keto reductase [Pseudomonadota bacterium]